MPTSQHGTIFLILPISYFWVLPRPLYSSYPLVQSLVKENEGNEQNAKMHKDAEACFDQRQNQQIIDLRWSQNSDSRSELLKKISLEDLQSWVYLFSDSELNGPVTLLSLSLFQICETLIIPDPSLIQISRSSLSSWAGLQSISNWVHYRSQHHKCLPSAGDFQEVLTLAANDVWLPMFTTAEYTEIIEDTGFLEKLQPVAACATGGLRSSSVWLVPDQWNIETISLPCGSVSESVCLCIRIQNSDSSAFHAKSEAWIILTSLRQGTSDMRRKNGFGVDVHRFRSTYQASSMHHLDYDLNKWITITKNNCKNKFLMKRLFLLLFSREFWHMCQLEKFFWNPRHLRDHHQQADACKCLLWYHSDPLCHWAMIVIVL